LFACCGAGQQTTARAQRVLARPTRVIEGTKREAGTAAARRAACAARGPRKTRSGWSEWRRAAYASGVTGGPRGISSFGY